MDSSYKLTAALRVVQVSIQVYSGEACRYGYWFYIQY